MSGAVFTLGNSVSGSLGLGDALSKFGRVAATGLTIEQDPDTVNSYLTTRYAGLSAVTSGGVTTFLNPSLVVIPSAYNNGIVYSLHSKQVNTGDFTVTRNTEARRVNSAGRIASVGSGLPRLDYLTSGGTVGTPALLVEPAGTNLVLQSEGFSVSGTWVPEGTNPTQVTANSTGTLDPAGGNTADIITLVSGNANQLRQSFVSTSGTTYTVSVFLKNIALTSGQTFVFSTTNQEAIANQVNCTVDLANLTITAATQGTGVTVSNAALDNYGNGWYRARFTFSFAVGGTNSYIRLRQPNNVGTNYAFYAWGAQLETGSVATSYIPTTTGTVTRNADIVTNNTFVIPNLIGAILTEFDSPTSGTYFLDNIPIPIASGSNKIAISYTPTTLTIYRNGAQVSGSPVTPPGGTAPVIGNVINIGHNNQLYQLGSGIKSFVLYSSTLSAAEASGLTT